MPILQPREQRLDVVARLRWRLVAVADAQAPAQVEVMQVDAFGLQPADVLAELRRREGQSGLEEFAARKLKTREGEGT